MWHTLGGQLKWNFIHSFSVISIKKKKISLKCNVEIHSIGLNNLMYWYVVFLSNAIDTEVADCVKKIMDFQKKKKRENCKSYRPEKWIDYAHHHSPQSIRFVVWYHYTNLFQYFFLRPIFTHFFHSFDPHCPVQVNRKNFQVQNFVFLTSELISTLNFSLENILDMLYFGQLFFSHQMSAKPRSDLEPCLIGYIEVPSPFKLTNVMQPRKTCHMSHRAILQI